jgi:outer membrane protein assembly factor BamB
MRVNVLSLLLIFVCVPCARPDAREDLWAAARKGDAKTVEKLLGQGVDVNAATSYGATALWFAAMNGKDEVIKILLHHHADLNRRDGIWNSSALAVATEFERFDTVSMLLRAGAVGANELTISAAATGNTKLLQTVLGSAKADPEVLSAALLLAPAGKMEIKDQLTKAGAVSFAKPFTDPSRLKPLEGDYEETRGQRVRIYEKQGFLIEQYGGHDAYVLKPSGEFTWIPIGISDESFSFERNGNQIDRFIYRRGAIETLYLRGRSEEAKVTTKTRAEEQAGGASQPWDWPSFRGVRASGVAQGQSLPASWDVTKGRNILWKTPLPGLAHSGPVSWKGKVFVTTAISSDPKSEFKFGLYGSGDSAKDESPHQWRVYCLDGATGKIVWDKLACEGVPRVKRHMKSSHANATPATDGKHLVVSFASEGLYCYDLHGNLEWKQDLGVLDDGAFNAPELQWESASSPIIYKDLVIVQCDRQKDSYLAAYDIKSGQRVWLTHRDEIPSWASPNVYDGPPRPELVTNGTNHICGYDPLTGAELWRLGPNSQITTPTPIFGEGLIFVTNGYQPIQPIYAIRPGGSGDISLKQGENENTYLAWSKTRGGPYTPTPILVDQFLYTCSNGGVANCYDAHTGKEIYRQRLGGGDGYSASPVSADGKIYFTSEAGEIRVIQAGPKFELLAVNKMNDPCMATPAIADGMLLVRSQHFLYAIGWPKRIELQ